MANLPTISQNAPWMWVVPSDQTGAAFGTPGNPISVTNSGGTYPNASVGTLNATLPTSATLIGISDGTNLQAVRGDQSGSEIRSSIYYTVTTPGDTAAPGTVNGLSIIPIVNGGAVTKTNAIPISNGGPIGTSVDQSASGTNAVVTATMPAVTGKTNYLTGYEISALPGTALSSADVTISGLQNTLTGEFVDTTSGPNQLIVEFNPPRPATGNNIPVSVSLAALGANSGKVSINVHGQNF